MKDEDCVAFLQWALPELHMRWPGFRKVRRQVCRRIDGRISELDLAGPENYREYLETNQDEWTVLDSYCRITISRFYRHRRVFDYLGEVVLPRLAWRAKDDGEPAVRCWSAGCASGEEIYTLKLLWHYHSEDLPSGVELEIVGTDVDPHMLDRAKRGCYPRGNLKELPEPWLEKHFERDGEEYCIDDAFKFGIDFKCQDIRHEQPPGPFHMILCRNLVFTYFEKPVQFNILVNMLERLKIGGGLVAGKQEPAPAEEAGLLEQAPHTGVYERARTK